MSCQRRNCRSGRPAAVVAVLVVYARIGGAPSRAPLTLHVCPPCSESMTLDDVILHAAWERVVDPRPGVHNDPERILMTFDFDPVAPRPSRR
jgi:hypothetical protein